MGDDDVRAQGVGHIGDGGVRADRPPVARDLSGEEFVGGCGDAEEVNPEGDAAEGAVRSARLPTGYVPV